MRIPKPSLGVVVAFTIVALLGAGVVYRITGTDTENGQGSGTDGERPTTSAGGAFATDIPIPVEGTEAIRDTLVIAVKADGQAAARGVAPIAAQVAGRVRAVLVRENQPVAEGQPLLRLDDTDYRLSVEEAEAAVRAAEAEYRSQTLFDDRIDNEEVRSERDRVARARSGLERAQVALKRAHMELARTVVRAPFGGRVSDLKVVQGQWVSAGTEVVTVADMDPIKVDARVLETEVPFLAQGRMAKVTFT
ncbi:MAG TPA: efflux RND transporter periplasmic adaptor subunit, partial [Longimicrobiales bacterium]|nr:efflux RND transporter periplasmic adaptor subunit [Longimicrobiales bacterium]